MALKKNYVYKIWRGNRYLGILPNVSTPFNYAQEINTAAVQITIDVNLNGIVTQNAVEAILDETGDPILDESGNIIYEERENEIFGPDNPDSLIQNNNTVRVYEFSADNPNGVLLFSGLITRWKAKFGADARLSAVAISDGTDLDNYLIQGGTSTLVSQTTVDNLEANDANLSRFSFGGWNLQGQSFTVPDDTINISAVDIMVNCDTEGELRVCIYTSAAAANSQNGGLINVSRFVEVGSNQVLQFTFATPLDVSPGQTLFLAIEPVNDDEFFGDARYNTTSVYAGGAHYQNAYGGGSGGGSYVPTPDGTTLGPGDLYFVLYQTTNATQDVYSDQEVSDILRAILDGYASRGGVISYDGTSIEDTGNIESYTFKVNTVLEGVKKLRELAPSDWFWYVDPATNLLYFKATPTTPDHTFIFGKHINDLDLEATVENVRNLLYFTGGDINGENLFIQYSNPDSIIEQGRQKLDRISDNRVTLEDTADTLSNGFLDEHSSEEYNTPLVIPDGVYNISSIQPGDTVGFNGSGLFIDRLVLQIARIVRYPHRVELTLGKLPTRQSTEVENIRRTLDKLQTVDNPLSPS